jgi:hypothetical protein
MKKTLLNNLLHSCLKTLVFCCLIIVSTEAYSQVIDITTIAGTGNNAFYGDSGIATNADINFPSGLAADRNGNVYIADMQNNRVRVVNARDSIFTFAGNGTGNYSGDNGAATAAELNLPAGVALDNAHNVYISDQRNNRVRKVNTSGIITTIAGNGIAGYQGDNQQGTAAEIDKPCQVATDKLGNVYFAEENSFCIRKVNTNGVISTVAGNGTSGYSGDGLQATAAELGGPIGVAVDTFGNIYISDPGNFHIRKVNTNGIISTIAGTGSYGYTGDNGPATAAAVGFICEILADNNGNLFVADPSFNRVREISGGIITAIAGSGSATFSGDNGPAIQAGMDAPYGLAMDLTTGIPFISDQLDNHVRELYGGIAGVNEVKVESESVKVFPNPNNGVFTLQLSVPIAIGISGQSSVEVYNMLGERVYSASLNPSQGATSSTTISLPFGESQSGAGVYFYRVILENGDLVGEGKFVIQ